MTAIIGSSHLLDHPFKEGLAMLIAKHFAPDIASRFHYTLEVELYNKKNPNIAKQIQDQRFVCEVYYTQPSGLVEYICDVASWWLEKECETHLLRMITDKFQRGLIGKDWAEKDGRIDKAVITGDIATELPDDLKTIYGVKNPKGERIKRGIRS